MNRNLGYIKIFLVVVLASFLFGFANKRHAGRKINEISVVFTANENLYVTEEAVNKLLIQNEVEVEKVDKETLDLNKVETILQSHDMIENAEVYLGLEGKLEAKLKQRKPIGRVVGNSSFYLDRNGQVMPLSPYYSARVPLLYGFDGANVVEVFPLLDFIRNDEFLNKLVTGIQRLPGDKFELSIRKLDFKVYFGTSQNIATKFNNFKAFYKKALQDNKLNAYKKVNLQFGNQVVCTKN